MSQEHSENLLERLDSVFSQRLKARVEKITEKPSEWIERYFYVPDPRDPITGEFLSPGPIRLSEHQKKIINEALSKDEHGKFKYSTVIYSAPKKSGKSAIASAVTLHVAFSRPYSFIYCLANDGKQSADRIYEPIHRCMRLHKTLNGPFYKENPNKTDITLSNNTRIEAIPCDAAGEAGSQPLLSVWSELWAFNSDAKRRLWCLDDQTQALTRSGWKNYSELTINDEFATLNTETNALEWQKPNSIEIFDYNDDLHVVDSRDMSLAVTPNHKFYGKASSSEYNNKLNKDSIYYVEDILKLSKFGIRAAADSYEQSEIQISEVTIEGTKQLPPVKLDLVVYLRLLGWYLSEGWTDWRLRKDGSRYYTRVNIAQKTGPYIPILEQDIKNTGLKYSKSKDGFRINDVRLAAHLYGFGLAKDKYIPRWIIDLPDKFVWEFLHTYHLGDGGKNLTTWTFFTTSPKLKDGLTEIGVRLRSRVRVTVLKKAKENHSDMYRVVFSVNNGKHRYIKQKYWEKRHYTGKVWCPSLPNGVFMVRRNERYYFSGNTELSIPPTLHGYAMRWVESYAGEKGKAELLEQLYNVAVKKGTPHPDFEDLKSKGEPVVWVNESARLFCYWDHEPRMPWQTDDYYSEEVSYHTPSEFARIHRNEWVTPTDVFIQAEWWHSLSKNLGPISPYTPVVIGLDGAISNDYAALVGVTRDPDNNEHTAVRFCYIFTPKRSGGTIKISETVEPLLRLLCKKYNVVCVAYDKYQLEDMAQRLRKESLVWMYNFSQQTERSVADKSLYDSIINRTIWWDINGEGLPFNGEVPSLYQHITQAGAKTDGGKFRLDKLSDDAKIDAAVATSMAREMCKRLMITNKDKRTESIVRQHTRGKMTDDEFMRAVAEIR